MIQTLSDALEQQGYSTLTPVQEAVTDPKLDHADLLVSAQTGSGKTVGFGLAIAPTLLGDETRFGPAATPLALIIAPTRELALQVRRELTWLYGKAGAVVTSCVGGMDMRDERRALDRGAHIVVATPGRLRDHIQRGSLDMNSLRAVVLDEADEMLDLGFREDLEFILSEAPEDRRTLMFSATVPAGIANLARSYQRDAVRVSTTAGTSQHADIEYRALTVQSREAENAIINVLRYYEAANAIVFCNTRAMVNRLTTRFSNRGFAVVALSGELSQAERSHALQAMRDGRARVCVATDVAARGIDLPNLELVIHAELPSNSDTMLHRSGRTGRAGRKGVSALIVTSQSRRKAERLLGMAKVQAEWASPPSAAEVLERDEERLMADPAWNEPVGKDERGFVDRLVAEFQPEQLAAAYLRLYRSRVSAPEELSTGKVEARPRESFGPGTWFSVSIGRDKNAEPRWLLPLLCRMGDITRDDIGAIRIQQRETFVEVLTTSVPGFLAAIGPSMQLEEGARLRQLDSAPDLASPPRAGGGKPRPERDDRGSKGGKPYKGNKGGAKEGKNNADSRAHTPPAGGWQADQGPPADASAKPRVEGAADDPRAQTSAKPFKAGKGNKPERFDPKGAGPSASKPWEKKGGKPGGKTGDKPGKPAKSGFDKKRESDPADRPRKGKDDWKAGKGKPEAKGKPDWKAKPDAPRKDAGTTSAKPEKRAAPDWASDPSRSLKPRGKGKPGAKFGKPGGKPSGKPGGKPAGKPGGKPGGKGGTAAPRRGKP